MRKSLPSSKKSEKESEHGSRSERTSSFTLDVLCNCSQVYLSTLLLFVCLLSLGKQYKKCVHDDDSFFSSINCFIIQIWLFSSYKFFSCDIFCPTKTCVDALRSSLIWYYTKSSLIGANWKCENISSLRIDISSLHRSSSLSTERKSS